jgi:hypothetical protein
MPDLTNRCVDSVPGSQSHFVTTDEWGQNADPREAASLNPEGG